MSYNDFKQVAAITHLYESLMHRCCVSANSVMLLMLVPSKYTQGAKSRIRCLASRHSERLAIARVWLAIQSSRISREARRHWPAAGQGGAPSSLHRSGDALGRAEQAADNRALPTLDLTGKHESTVGRRGRRRLNHSEDL